MSNWRNDNWSGNDSAHVPVEVIPRALRRAMRFSFRLYVLVVCVGVFGWTIYATIQAVHKLKANAHTSQPASTPQHHHLHSTKGQRP